MYVKTVTYENFNGDQVTETLHFHLNKAEVVQWLTMNGDYTLDKLLVQLAVEKNGQRIMEIFDDLITRSYGSISVDGKTFEKDEKKTKAFKGSEAYSIIFCEVVSNQEKAVEFIKGCIPKKLAEDVEKASANSEDIIPEELKRLVNASKDSQTKTAENVVADVVAKPAT